MKEGEHYQARFRGSLQVFRFYESCKRWTERLHSEGGPMASPCWAPGREPGKEQMLKNDLLKKMNKGMNVLGCTYPNYEDCSFFSICAFINVVTNIC